MTTFDLAEVRDFAANLDARMDRCDRGEGTECATVDDALWHYAKLCCEFSESIRTWAHAVFTGRVAFDPAVQQAWLDEGSRLLSRARQISVYGRKAEVPCYILEGRSDLESALGDLEQLLKGWVTPKLAVGPAARQPRILDPAKVEEVRRRVASLPSLPQDWEPDDPRQREIYRKLRTS